jgi:hypothetical protein
MSEPNHAPKHIDLTASDTTVLRSVSLNSSCQATHFERANAERVSGVFQIHGIVFCMIRRGLQFSLTERSTRQRRAQKGIV